MVIKCVDIVHDIYTFPCLQNVLTGNKLRGAYNAFCHTRLQNALQWTHNLLPFQRILLPGNKMRCGSKIGAYI